MFIRKEGIMENAKIRLITDSGCDILPDDEKKYGIDILPFEIVLGDKSYWERIDVSNQEFYKLINESEHLPKTAQITPIRFEEKFAECFKDGVSEIITVLINSGGSQTYANALLARDSFFAENPDAAMKIHIIDSHCYSLGYGYPILEAAKMLESGKTSDEAIAYLEDWFSCLEIYIVAFNLRHLKKSGRVTAAAAFLGELMGLKPVISLIDGESSVVKKSRGEKNAVLDAVAYIKERRVGESPWQVLRTVAEPYENLFIDEFTKASGCAPDYISFSGGVVSSNAGPNMLGVLVKGKPRR